MRNGLFLSVGIFVLSHLSVASAQMIDMMSNMAIQGQLTAQGTKNVQTALGMFKQNEIMNQMNLIIADIQMRPNGYAGLNKSQMNFNIPSVEWNVGSNGNNQFFIELKNIDLSSCSRFTNAFSNAQSIIINNTVGAQCTTNNTIKFIFN